MKLDALPLPIAAIFIAVPFLAACGDDGQMPVIIDMALDPDSCGASDPGDVFLDCDATLGVWLVESGSDLTIDQGCVDLDDSSGSYDLGDLRSLIDDIDLNGPPATRASVRVAVYTPWRAEDGCLRPDEIEQTQGVVPSIVIRGASLATRLSDTNGHQTVFLSCESAASPVTEMCEADCAVGRDQCSNRVATVACTGQQDDCLQLCEDEACSVACNAEYADCLSESVDGRCQRTFEECLPGCVGDEECLDSCGDSLYQCLDLGCTGQYDDCFFACPDAECASFPG
jgi:hypothetical protein